MVLLQYQLLLNREKYEEFTYQKQLLTMIEQITNFAQNKTSP